MWSAPWTRSETGFYSESQTLRQRPGRVLRRSDGLILDHVAGRPNLPRGRAPSARKQEVQPNSLLQLLHEALEPSCVSRSITVKRTNAQMRRVFDGKICLPHGGRKAAERDRQRLAVAFHHLL